MLSHDPFSGAVDGHPDAAHDIGAADPEAEQPGGEEERLGHQVRQEDRLEPGLHQRVAQDGGCPRSEAGFSGQAFAQRPGDRRTGQ